jgi:hypothetical protein
LFHNHRDHSGHHHHLVFHSHSDLIPTIPTFSEIESQEKEHEHPVGKPHPVTYSQTVSKRQKYSESKNAGSESFVDTPCPQPFFSKQHPIFLPHDESPPEKIFLLASSGRSPPLA